MRWAGSHASSRTHVRGSGKGTRAFRFLTVKLLPDRGRRGGNRRIRQQALGVRLGIRGYDEQKQCVGTTAVETSRRKKRRHNTHRHDLMRERCSQGGDRRCVRTLLDKQTKPRKSKNTWDRRTARRNVKSCVKSRSQREPRRKVVKILLVTTTSTGDGLRAAVGGRRQAAGDTTRTE